MSELNLNLCTCCVPVLSPSADTLPLCHPQLRQSPIGFLSLVGFVFGLSSLLIYIHKISIFLQILFLIMRVWVCLYLCVCRYLQSQKRGWDLLEALWVTQCGCWALNWGKERCVILTSEPSVQALSILFRISPILVNFHLALYSHWWGNLLCFVPPSSIWLGTKGRKGKACYIVELTQDSQKAISTASAPHTLTGQVHLWAASVSSRGRATRFIYNIHEWNGKENSDRSGSYERTKRETQSAGITCGSPSSPGTRLGPQSEAAAPHQTPELPSERGGGLGDMAVRHVFRILSVQIEPNVLCGEDWYSHSSG